jgi:hypothetical protein
MPEFMQELFSSIVSDTSIYGRVMDSGEWREFTHNTIATLTRGKGTRLIPTEIASRMIDKKISKEDFIMNYLDDLSDNSLNELKASFSFPENSSKLDFYGHLYDLFIELINYSSNTSADTPLFNSYSKSKVNKIELVCLTLDALKQKEENESFKNIWIVTYNLREEFSQNNSFSRIVPNNLKKGTVYTYFIPENTNPSDIEAFRDHCKICCSLTDEDLNERLVFHFVKPAYGNEYIGFPMEWGYQIYEPLDEENRIGYQGCLFHRMRIVGMFKMHEDIIHRLILILERIMQV